MSSPKRIAALLAAALVLNACGAEASTATAEVPQRATTNCAAGENNAGVTIGPNWGGGQERNLTIVAVSSGAGVDPAIGGLALTTPISARASAQQDVIDLLSLIHI